MESGLAPNTFAKSPTTDSVVMATPVPTVEHELNDRQHGRYQEQHQQPSRFVVVVRSTAQTQPEQRRQTSQVRRASQTSEYGEKG